MLTIKAIHQDNLESIYHFLSELKSENGFENTYFGVSFDDFKNKYFIDLLRSSKGIEVREGFVPNTYYFLWYQDQIVGLFKVRHFLNDKLRHGSGHIGYAIHPKFRGKGFATEGLKLIIKEIKDWIVEDELYFSCNKDNPASLKVQLASGAYIHHEDDKHYYARIKIR